MKLLIVLLATILTSNLYAAGTAGVDADTQGSGESKHQNSDTMNKFQSAIQSVGTSDDAGYGSGSSQIPLNKKGGTSYNFCHSLLSDSNTINVDENSLVTAIVSKLNPANSKIKFGADKAKEYTPLEAKQLIQNTIESGSKALECVTILVTMKDSDPLEDANSFGQADTKKSMDGAVSCTSDGLTSIDYPACSRAVTAYNSFLLGQQAMDAYQGIDLQKTNIEEQANVNASDAASALSAQQASIDKQSDQMKEKAMVQATKAATLFQMIRLMPTTNSIAAKCAKQSQIIQKAHEEIKQAVSTHLASIKIKNGGEDQEALEKLAAEYGFKHECTGMHNGEVGCAETQKDKQQHSLIIESGKIITISNEGNYLSGSLNDDICYDVGSKNNVARNTKAIDQLKYALAQSGIAVASAMMMANMLDDRSDQIEDLKNKLNDYDPSANGFTFLPAELAKFCEENPTDSRCAVGLPQGASRFGTAGMNIQFGDAGGATTFEQGTLDTGSDWDANSTATNSDLGADISPRFAAEAQKGGGFTGAGRGAAAIRSAAINKGGGGSGGGGAPGGVAAPSGGNLQTGQQANYGDYQPKLKQTSYSGGASKLTYSSAARNLSKKKKDSASNPFSKMFGKKKNGENMNFRGIASKEIPQGGSIFQRISRRYQIENGKKKLLTYETVE